MKERELLFNALNKGQENARTRQELCSITGLPDRKLRKLIEHMINEEGYLILSSSRTAGYYLPKDFNDVDAVMRELKAKANSDLKRSDNLYINSIG